VQVSRVVKLAKLVIFLVSQPCIATQDSGSQEISAMTRLVRMINLGKVYFYPSNHSSCTSRLVAFCDCLVKELAKCIGRVSVGVYHGNEASPLSASKVFEIVDLLRPLLQQGVFSENTATSSSCASSLRTLAFISPCRVAPHLTEFMVLSLGEHSVNSTHMFPAGIMLLASLIQPLLYPFPLIADTLPQLLQMSLSGIDPNNQQKTMKTLSM
jgi:hypothetical protein